MSAGDWSEALILSCLSSSLITQLLSLQYTVALQSSELGHGPSIWILKDIIHQNERGVYMGSSLHDSSLG